MCLKIIKCHEQIIQFSLNKQYQLVKKDNHSQYQTDRNASNKY